MKFILKLFVCIILTSMLFYVSCQKELSCENCKGNKPPVANAGTDQVITLPTDSVSMDGSSSSDPDGKISGYAWTKISGPASFNITNSSIARTVVKNLAAGSYLFELKVTDNDGLSAKDTMRITVDSVITANHPPIANAGADQNITLPVDTITLNGSASFDADSNITSYIWSKISGPSSFNIANANAVQAPVTNLVQGTYQFELKVTDAGGLFAKDTVQLTLNAATTNNLPPVANAGNDTTIQINQTSCTPVSLSITLNGSTSYDPDGTIVNYLWTGPGVITNDNSAVTIVSGIIPVVNSFILKVTDNNGTSTFDTVQITIITADRPLVPAQLIPFGTLSEARSIISTASAGNKILFAGGMKSTGDPSSTVDIYDIATQSWTAAQLSLPRYLMASISVGNKIYFAGGHSTNIDTPSSRVDIFDVASNSWSTAELSEPRSGIAAATIGSKIMFAGGTKLYKCSACYSDKIDIYDMATNSWSVATLSVAREGLSATAAGNKIYFAGGGDWAIGNGVYDQIDIYDNASNTWSTSTLNERKSHHGAIAIGNYIYWAGGEIFNNFNDYETTCTVERRDWLNGASTILHLFNRSYAFGNKHPSMKTLLKNGSIVFYTGSNQFDIYDPGSDVWSIGMMNQGFVYAGAISVNNIIYIAGGGYLPYTPLSNQVWRLDF